jgi:hypothetical protein
MDDIRLDPPRRPSMGSMIVWVLFCCAMWFWAISGPLIVLAGVLEFLNVPFIAIEGPTTEDKVRLMGMGAVLGAVGLGFVWLRLRGYLKFGDQD